jgi:hypothetical protein
MKVLSRYNELPTSSSHSIYMEQSCERLFLVICSYSLIYYRLTGKETSTPLTLVMARYDLQCLLGNKRDY